MPLIVSPPPRWSAVMAELPTSSELVLFGGKTEANLYNGNIAYSGLLNDTWVFNSSSQWASISTGYTTSGSTTTLIGPPPRYDAAMSFDGTYVTMMGGASGTASLSDTWSYKTAGGWIQQPETEVIGTATYNPTYGEFSGPVGTPPSYNVFSVPTYLKGACMAYRSGTGAVLFGGQASYQRNYVLDTWVWTEGTASWAIQSPAAWPVARTYAAMASNGGTTVMFGGKNFSGGLSDTNVYNGTTWSTITTGQTPGVSSPSARYGASMVYHAPTSQYILFGGVTTNGYAFDLWAFSTGTNLWTNISVGTPGLGAPLGRAFAAMAYNSATTSTILFGGLNSTRGLGDTWSFSSGLWTQLG